MIENDGIYQSPGEGLKISQVEVAVAKLKNMIMAILFGV